MPDEIVQEAAESIAAAIDDAREEAVAATLEADQAAAEVARLDAIEHRLASIEASTVQAPAPATDPGVSEVPGEAIDRIEAVAEQVAEAAASLAGGDDEEDASDGAVDTTQDNDDGIASEMAEAVESGPKRSHIMFKRLFGGRDE